MPSCYSFWIRVSKGLRNVTSVTCGCKWSIRFLGIIRNKTKLSDHVVITDVNVMHSNSCDPSYVGKHIFCRTRSSEYKRCGDEVLSDIWFKWILTFLLMLEQ